jgi:hypothetical protein
MIDTLKVNFCGGRLVFLTTLDKQSIKFNSLEWKRQHLIDSKIL